MNNSQPIRLALRRPIYKKTSPTPATRRISDRSARLIAAADSAYCALDRRVASGVTCVQQYGRFLRVLYRLYGDVDVLYGHPDLQRLVPQLDDRRRYLKLANVLSYLGIDIPAIESRFMSPPAWPVALGWLFVVEATNLYAVALHRLITRKGQLGMFAGSYLFDAEGTANSAWHSFVMAVDNVVLLSGEERQLFDAASHAILRLHRHVEVELR